METTNPSRGKVLVAVLFILSCVGIALYVWTSFGGRLPLEAKGYRFQAIVPGGASNLFPNADVRIAGVPVGKVVSSAPRGVRTVVVMQLDSKYAPLPSDTRLITRTKTLLGEAFVELTPGSPHARPLPDGGTLPASQVQTNYGLDAALAAFDARTRTALKRLLNEVGAGLKGRGEDLNAALGNAGPAVDDLSAALAIADRQQTAVSTLVRAGAASLGALARRRSDLQTVAVAGDAVLSTTAARDRQLTATVRALPPLLRELRLTLSAARGATADADPVLRDLEPAAPLLQPALREASTLAPQVTALFRDLKPFLPVALRAIPYARRIINSSVPLVKTLSTAGRDIVPLVQYIDAYRREVGVAFANFPALLQPSEQLPNGLRYHYVRGVPSVLTNEIPFGLAQRLPTNRYNPYFAPGGLDELGRGGLLSWDCRHTGNPLVVPVIGTGVPPCRTQPPWTFQGQTASYHHVARAPR